MSKQLPYDLFALVEFEGIAGKHHPLLVPFTIHIPQRSSVDHPFLHTEIQVIVSKYLPQVDRVLDQLTSPITPQPSAKPSKKPSQPIRKADGSQVYHIGADGRKVAISVSPEQYAQYFDPSKKATPPAPQKSISPKADDRVFDLFLQNPKRIRKTAAQQAPASTDKSIKASLEADDEMVTETLAKLHLRQGNKSDAIHIYEKLSLLFPEKSSYFEAQIEKIRNK